MVVLPAPRGPGTATMGVMPNSRRWRTWPTRWRRVAGTDGAGSPRHHGLNLYRVSTNSGGRGRGVWGGGRVFTVNLFGMWPTASWAALGWSR